MKAYQSTSFLLMFCLMALYLSHVNLLLIRQASLQEKEAALREAKVGK